MMVRGYVVVLCALMAGLFLFGCAGTAPQEVVAETVDTINQTSSVVTNEMEPWVLGVIILLAGWAIPSPTEMIKGIANLFRG